MARPGFYNDNEYRDYPFLTRVKPREGTDLPHEAIVDFGAIMGLDSEYAEPDSYVYLHSIQRSGDALRYEFRTTAEGAADEALVFTRELADPEFKLQWADSTPIGALDRPYCFGAPKWEGFLVTGLFEELLLALPGDGELLFAETEWQIEPARIQSLIKTFLRSVSLANFPRTQVTVPQCESESEPPEEAIVNATCMKGDLKFKEGYNCAIQQNTPTNTIIIGASVGGGSGSQCVEIPLYPGESPPPGSRYLTGGPSCGEIIKTVNGVGGRKIQLTSGPGFRVAVDARRAHTLTISMELGDFAACLQHEGGSISDISLGSIGSGHDA